MVLCCSFYFSLKWRALLAVRPNVSIACLGLIFIKTQIQGYISIAGFRGNLSRHLWFLVAAILLELPSGFLVIYGFTLQTYVMLADLILGIVMIVVDGVTTLLILATLITNLATWTKALHNFQHYLIFKTLFSCISGVRVSHDI